MNLRQKIAVIVTDILLIAEVCISMYVSIEQSPENLTPTFIKSFALMSLPTLIMAKMAINRLRTPKTSSSSKASDIAAV